MATKASSSSSESFTVISCFNCHRNVPQSQGTRRTICPHCGSFFGQEEGQTGQQPMPRPPAEPRRHNRAQMNPNRIVRAKNNNSPHSYTSNNNDGAESPAQALLANGPQFPRRGSADERQSREVQQKQRPLNSVAKFFSNLRSKSGRRGSRGSDSGSASSQTDRYTKNRNSLTPTTHGVNNQLPPISPVPSLTGKQDKSRMKKAESQPSLVHLSAHCQEDYPNCATSVEQLEEQFSEAKETKEWTVLTGFLTKTFGSFWEMSGVFKMEHEPLSRLDGCEIKEDLLKMVYEIMVELPREQQKLVLKAIINSLLQKKQNQATKDDIRCFYILLQNPLFEYTNTFVIFAHLLRVISALPDYDHHYLVHWLQNLQTDKFTVVVHRLQNFISVRLFPPKPQELPPLAKATWWIPSATKVLALLNAANNLCSPPKINYEDFYNHTLDHLDLMSEYYSWQNPSTHPGFTFCQYPFILSILAKRQVLQRDSEQQMIIMARRSLVAKMQSRQVPDMGMLFLNLNVRRDRLVEDSLHEISTKQQDLKKKLKVTFKGEPGLDMGGLTKEWFLLLIRRIFIRESGMFTYDSKARVYWFSPATYRNLQEFQLVGVLMGLAVYNGINLDVRFPAVCYRKLLSPAVVPHGHPDAVVGSTSVTLSDLKQVSPDLANGLREMLDYDGNVEDDFCATFEVSYNDAGQVKTKNLVPNGNQIPVTKENRRDYVQYYCDWILNKSIYDKFKAFYHGFHSVCASNALIMLRSEEVENLVCGSPQLNLVALCKVTVYDGFKPTDPYIKWFWETVVAFTLEMQKKLLLFATGSDRIPVGGMAEMTFKITRVANQDMLPMAHTCFNQVMLPPYKSKALLKEKLLIAIQNSEGFGIE